MVRNFSSIQLMLPLWIADHAIASRNDECVEGVSLKTASLSNLAFPLTI